MRTAFYIAAAVILLLTGPAGAQNSSLTPILKGEAAIGAWDLNRDGRIDQMEWETVLADKDLLTNRRTRDFLTWDRDHDGFIDVMEAAKIPRR